MLSSISVFEILTLSVKPVRWNCEVHFTRVTTIMTTFSTVSMNELLLDRVGCLLAWSLFCYLLTPNEWISESSCCWVFSGSLEASGGLILSMQFECTCTACRWTKDLGLESWPLKLQACVAICIIDEGIYNKIVNTRMRTIFTQKFKSLCQLFAYWSALSCAKVIPIITLLIWLSQKVWESSRFIKTCDIVFFIGLRTISRYWYEFRTSYSESSVKRVVSLPVNSIAQRTKWHSWLSDFSALKIVPNRLLHSIRRKTLCCSNQFRTDCSHWARYQRNKDDSAWF